ncbi:MAG: phage major capsid protein, partial [Woeseia sp.]
MSEVLKAVHSINDSIEDFKQRSDKTIESLQERIESLEAHKDRPSLAGKNGYSRDESEHKDVFLEWVRDPHNGAAKRRMDDAQQEMINKKAVTIGSDASGGYALPAIIASQVEQRVTTLNPFRRVCRVQRVGSSDYAHLVSKNQAGSGWVGEGDSRSETDTSDLVERKP